MHEIGHFKTAHIFKFKVDKIYLYPTGGISKFTSELNVSWLKEFLVLINGPLMQYLTYLLLLKIYPYQNSLEFLRAINYSILLFNLLPIYPLDGGKIVNLVLSVFLPFRKSFNYTIIISYIIIFLLIIIIPFNFKINYLFLISFLIYKVTEENKKKHYYFDKFLLERYLYSYCFTKVKIVPSINEFKRGYKHIINNDNAIMNEKEALSRKFYHYT